MLHIVYQLRPAMKQNLLSVNIDISTKLVYKRETYKMKRNLKILFIQFGVLAFGSLFCEYFFNIPKWLGFAISGLMFFLVFFIIQIKGTQNNKEKEVSSDGIAGARMCGIFISAILQAFILGIYIYQIVNIVMVIIGIILLTIERKKMGSFFFENRWENKFWYIYRLEFYYLWCVFYFCVFRYCTMYRT